jgi:type II secretory pathway pseudopilin PulG
VSGIFFKRGRDRRHTGDSGFTLVEVLATFVLLALILPVAMQGISLAMKLGTKSKRQIAAAALAESRLSEMILSGDYEDGDQSGEIDDEDSDYDYTWDLAVDDWNEEDSMQQVTMTVTWTDSVEAEHSVVLSTLVYTESEDETESE